MTDEREIEKGRANDVLLGFADNGNVATVFMASVLNAFSEDARRGNTGQTRRLTEYFNAPGPYIHDNRARIARYFLEYTDKQWLWMIDNDIEFPAHALYQLLDAAEEHECKILGGAYWNQYPGSECYLSWLVMTPRGIVAAPELPTDRSQPVEISATGMGCTLIHRSVLQDVAEMYAGDPWDTFAADIIVRFEDGGILIGRTPDDFEDWGDREVADTHRMGEDVSFCLRARRAGYVTYGLPSLVVEHHKAHKMSHGGSALPTNGSVGADSKAKAHV